MSGKEWLEQQRAEHHQHVHEQDVCWEDCDRGNESECDGCFEEWPCERSRLIAALDEALFALTGTSHEADVLSKLEDRG